MNFLPLQQYIRLHRQRFVRELEEFNRFPTISAQPKHANDIRRGAEWLANHLHGIGLDHVQVIPTAQHPLVYADWLYAKGKPTLLVYGHYDVQPADPNHEWRFPPFQPTTMGDNLYGRGACDDKGLFTHIKAIEGYLQTEGALPVNVKCLFEGEEEIGSPNLPKFPNANYKRLQANVAVMSDMPIIAPNRPAITYAMRGALSVEIEVAGPEQDLHSGIFGGVIHNPRQVLCQLIAGLHDSQGRITIPGFYNRVRRWSKAERDYMAEVGPSDENLLCNAKVPRGWGESGHTGYERTTIRPSLSINGIIGAIRERVQKP